VTEQDTLLREILEVKAGVLVLSEHTKHLADKVGAQNGRIAILEAADREVAQIHARQDGARALRKRDLVVAGLLLVSAPTVTGILAIVLA
jgi:hypothetical protein